MEAFLKNFDLTPIDLPMIFFGAVFFFVFCKIFGKYVIRPYLQLIEARESASEGTLQEAAADLRAAADLQKDFEAYMNETRLAAIKKKADTIDRAKKDAAKLIENAESQARLFLESERLGLKQVIEEARHALHKEEGNLASLVLQKLELDESSIRKH